MIMEDFVPFEIAKKLKEKGFREPCFGWYPPSGVCVYGYLTSPVSNQSDCRGEDYEDLLISHNDDKHIDAPTISQVLKWLREKDYIHLEITIGEKGWESQLVHYRWQDEIGGVEIGSCCDTYEEVALKGIEYILDTFI